MRTSPRAVSSRRSLIPVNFLVSTRSAILRTKRFFVQSIWNFGNNNLVAALVAFDDFGNTAGNNATTAGCIGGAD